MTLSEQVSQLLRPVCHELDLSVKEYSRLHSAVLDWLQKRDSKAEGAVRNLLPLQSKINALLTADKGATAEDVRILSVLVSSVAQSLPLR